MVISAMPATNVLANVYQLYMVLYQCASILISHNQGIEDITVNEKNTMKMADHTVLSQIYFFASSLFNGLSSILRDILRNLAPSKLQPTRVMMVQTIKNPLFKNPALCNNILSCFTCSVSVQ